MDLLDAPLRTTEFLALDVETNGCAGEDCELTEVGTVLVGGGELHERWESLVAARGSTIAAPPTEGSAHDRRRADTLSTGPSR